MGVKPVVLITADRREPSGFHVSPRIRPKRPECWVYEAYLEAVRRAGGLPLVVPPGDSDLERLLAIADGVLLTGGDMDIHPSWYGEDVQGRLDRVEPSRTDLEIRLAQACLAQGVPVLGVCGGMQVLAVASGGSLIQDLPVPSAEAPDRIQHEQPTDPAKASHVIRVEPPAAMWLGQEVWVNSTHHQAVKDPGTGLVACGWSPDGVVEVIASAGPNFALGVQWHPEILGQEGAYVALTTAARQKV
jgi:putative glutamine amidotransferase